jgi:hypothetical protein
VDEYVLSATIPSDEAEAPLDIESFHRAGFLADERGGGRLIGQAMACMVGLIATAAMTIMVYPVIVTPVWRRRSIITDIGCAIVNRGWNVINGWRIDRRSDEGRKPEADPNADSAVCPSRGRGHQNSGEYRSESHRPAPGPSNNATKPIHVHSLAFSLP